MSTEETAVSEALSNLNSFLDNSEWSGNVSSKKTLEKRVSKSLSNLKEFLDYSEWIGRIPSAKSLDKYEKRMSFWLIHMKQAKQGKSTCLWHNEIEEEANSRGYAGLFTQDPRTLRYFNFLGFDYSGIKVLGKSEELSCKNQTMWMTDQGLISGYRLSRLKNKEGFSSIEKTSSNFIGKKIGGLELVEIFDLSEERSIWYASSEEKSVIVTKKVNLPSLNSLSRHISILNGEPVESVLPAKNGVSIFDMTAKKIGRWTVIGFSHKASNNECVWDCICDCGTISKVPGGKLRNGCSLSCGCLRKENSPKL